MTATGSTRVAAVIGDPVAHSLSPVLHNAAFAALGLDWAFLAFEVPDGATSEAVAGARALGLEGLSVTMPHKEAAVGAVDRCSATVERLGALNTIVRRGAVLVGESTDGVGFVDSLRLDEGWDPDGRRCVVLGAGGAARAVILALAEAGASDVAVVGRSPGRAEAAAVLAGTVGRVGTEADAAAADLVVNATPVGMDRVVDARHGTSMPIDPTHLGRGQLVADLVYWPPVTGLVAAARARGATAVNGLGMLLHQAAHAFRLWTGEDPPLEVMSAAALARIGLGDDNFR